MEEIFEATPLTGDVAVSEGKIPPHKHCITHNHYYTDKHEEGKHKMSNPMETINLFANPMGGMGGVGAGAGAGLGAGLLGGVLGGALLGGRGGLFGGRGEEGGFVTPTQLQTATTGIIESNQNNAVLQTLGDIKGAIPLAESQVQLALAGSTSEIMGAINTTSAAQALASSGINQNIAAALANVLSSQASIKETVTSFGVANLTATKDSQYAIATAVRDDGDKTRALIVSQNDQMLNRELAVAQSALLEERAIGRSREVEVNVSQTVNQNQNQLQAQQQSQQQIILLAQIAQGLANVTQLQHATNSNIIAGNTGAVTTGMQSNTPTNVNTR
jgi:hypothetical protein